MRIRLEPLQQFGHEPSDLEVAEYFAYDRDSIALVVWGQRGKSVTYILGKRWQRLHPDAG